MGDFAIHKVKKAKIWDVFRLAEESRYIYELAALAAYGGALFGYNTGVISGALLYIRDEFPAVQKNTSLQGTIVSITVAGAIFGAVLGGWISDKFGRKTSILVADFLLFVGPILIALAPSPAHIIVGRIFVGLGVGIVSLTVPLYLSEASPARIRGALVSLYGLLIIGGQFSAYYSNCVFAQLKGTATWRWTLGAAMFPALMHFLSMFRLPESPRWLYRKADKKDEAVNILKKICPAEELDEEVESLKSLVKAETVEEDYINAGNMLAKLKDAWHTPIVRKGLATGIGVQVFQQLVGINLVMYYSPTIFQFAGIASNSTALALGIFTCGLSALCSITSICRIDNYRRKTMMIISMIGISACLGGLAILFKVSDVHAPKVSELETSWFGNATCPGYFTAPNVAVWNCRSCLDASFDCAFCSNSGNLYEPGACVAVDSISKTLCQSGGKSELYTQGCPSKGGMLAIVVLSLYIISYSLGMGTVPWIVNSEIYPLRHRGICAGMAALANWMTNLIVSQAFLPLTKAVGFSHTFLILAGFSVAGLLYIIWIVPETKGLSVDEVEEMLEARNVFLPWKKKKSWLSEEKVKLLPS